MSVNKLNTFTPTNEAELQEMIQAEAAKHGLVLMRNNSGVLRDENGRPVRFGLANDSAAHNKVFKSSDLIGCMPVTITPDMLGRTIGVFVAVEVKKPGWNTFKKLNEHEAAQDNFLAFISKRGGLSFFASSIDDLLRHLKRF